MIKGLVKWQAAGALALAALLHSPAASAQADPVSAVAASDVDPVRLAIASEIVAIAFPEDKREAIFGSAMDATLEQMRATMFSSLKNDVGAEKIVNRKVDSFVAGSKDILRDHMQDLLNALAKAYTREFSEAELSDMRAFARTDTGRHFFQRSSAVMSDPSFKAANEAYMRDLMPSVTRMQTELVDELSNHFRENPPKDSAAS